MSFEAHMRVGSLEIAATLLLVAVAAGLPRVRPTAEIGRLQPMRVGLEFNDTGRTRFFEGRPPFDIGRARELEVSIRDPQASRRHARFESRNGVVSVIDLKSSNGTFVNGRRVTAATEILQGDTVDVGATRIFVRKVAPWT